MRAWLRLAAALLLLYLLAAVSIAWDGRTDALGRADVAIVLGNTVEPNGQPSARLKARLDRAVELYRQGYVPAIIVSGGLGREGHDEAAVMERYLLDQGLPAAQIHRDSAGNTTMLTAINAAAIMRERGYTSAIVVTQYFHIPRARLALQSCGVAQVHTAHARFSEPRDLYSTLREVPALTSYAWRGCER